MGAACSSAKRSAVAPLPGQQQRSAAAWTPSPVGKEHADVEWEKTHDHAGGHRAWQQRQQRATPADGGKQKAEDYHWSKAAAASADGAKGGSRNEPDSPSRDRKKGSSGRKLSRQGSKDGPSGSASSSSASASAKPLKLQSVAGYRGHDAHNNVHATASGALAYPAGAVVVVANAKTGEQAHFMEHTDSVLALALDADGRLAASAQGPLEPGVLVWDTQALSTVAELKAVRAIDVAFTAPPVRIVTDKSGHREQDVGACRVLTLSMAAGATGAQVVQLWDIEKSPPTVVAQVSMPRERGDERVFQVIADPFDATSFTTVGVGHVGTWQLVTVQPSGRALIERGGGAEHQHVWAIEQKGDWASKGAFNTKCAPATATCGAYSDKGVLHAGMANGSIYSYVDGSLRTSSRAGQAHDALQQDSHGKEVAVGAVLSMATDQTQAEQVLAAAPMQAKTVASCGADGMLYTWHWDSKSSMLNRLNAFSVKSATPRQDASGSGEPKRVVVRSLYLKDADALLGTAANEVMQMKLDTGASSAVAASLGEGDVLAMATSCDSRLFVTGDSTGAVRVWDLSSGGMSSSSTQVEHGRAVCSAAFSPNDKHLALGLDNGSVVILRVGSYERVKLVSLRTGEVDVLAYSPDGKQLAVGAADLIYMLQVTDEYRRGDVNSGHSGSMQHIDWSADSKRMRSNDSEYELLFWERRSDGNWDHKDKAEKMRGTEWATNTCPFTSSSAAAFSGNAKANSVLSCDERKSSVLAVGGDGGAIRVFDYPATSPGRAAFTSRVGSAPISFVRWLSEGADTLVAVSATDRVAYVWVPVAPPKRAKKSIVHDVPAAEEDLVKPFMFDPVEVGQANGYDSDIELDGQRLRPRKHNSAQEATSISKGHQLGDAVPEQQLHLDHVYGYNGLHSTCNVAHESDDVLIYPAAATGIVHDLKTGRQKFFGGHEDEILCLTHHSSLGMVASGETGDDPKLCLWYADCESICTVHTGSHHQGGISAVAFSPNGRKVATAGVNGVVAVWDSESTGGFAKMVGPQFTSKTKCGKVMSLAFGMDDKTLVAGGLDGLAFVGPNSRSNGYGVSMAWEKNAHGLGNAESHLSVLAIGGTSFLTGTSTGDICFWENMQNRRRIRNAHAGPIYSLNCNLKMFDDDDVPDELQEPIAPIASAGKDGKVRLWSSEMKPMGTISMPDELAKQVDDMGRPLSYVHPKKAPVVRSVDLSGRSVAIGTRSGELFRWNIDAKEMTLVAQGHSAGQTCALAVHPRAQQFATASDDNTVRLWDIENRKMLSYCNVGEAASCLAINPEGTQIAVGLAAGDVVVLAADTLKRVHTVSSKGGKSAVHAVKFSPNGRFVAVSTADLKVEVFDVVGKYRRVNSCAGHKHGLLFMDWSEDSKYLQGAGADHEVLFWDATSYSKPMSTSDINQAMKLSNWATWTLPVGAKVTGLFPKKYAKDDIASVDVTVERDLIATVDAYRCIRLLNYPCTQSHAECKFTVSGHGDTITNCRFTFDEKYLITTGSDLCAFQWKLAFDDSHGGALMDDDDSDLECDIAPQYPPTSRIDAAEKGGPRDKRSFLYFDHEKDLSPLGEAEASKAMQPSGWKSGSGKPPKEDLALEHIHGYRGHDSRANVRLIGDQYVVYPAACIGVVYDVRSKSQSFYTEHTDAVTCLAQSPIDGSIIATGQLGTPARVNLWNAKTRETIAEVPTAGVHMAGISTLAFNAEGDKLVTVGMDHDGTIAIWQVFPSLEPTPLAVVRASHARITQVSMSGVELAAVGISGARFFTFEDGVLTRQRAKYRTSGGVTASSGRRQAILCAERVGEMLWTGTASGDIYIWRGSEIAEVKVKVHQGPVHVIAAGASWVVSGGKDGILREWEPKGAPKGRLDLRRLMPQRGGIEEDDFGRPASYQGGKPPSIRAVHRAAGMLVVGTKSNEVYLMGGVAAAQPERSVGKHVGAVQLVTQGMSTGSVSGLAAHPLKAMFYTAGTDRTLRAWDAAASCLLEMRTLPAAALSVAIDGSAKLAAVGLDDGQVMLLRADNLRGLSHMKLHESGVADVKFSPGGELLAAAYSGGFIDIYAVAEGRLRQLATLSDAAAGRSLKCVDWCQDGRYLVSSGPGGLAFFDAAGCSAGIEPKAVDAKAVRDVEWDTWSSGDGWAVAGVAGATTVARTRQGELMASGGVSGVVALSRWPCPEAGNSSEWVGHAGEVSGCAFVLDKQLMTVGGDDLSVMSWKVVGASGKGEGKESSSSRPASSKGKSRRD